MKKEKSSSKTPTKKLPVTVDKDSSMAIRKIENGYLISESGTRGTGRNAKWYQKEYYSPTNPLKEVKTTLKFGGKK